MDIFEELYNVIMDRKANPVEGSYTNYLMNKGTEKIAKKVGEEAVETAIAAAKKDKNEVIAEIADNGGAQRLAEAVGIRRRR